MIINYENFLSTRFDIVIRYYFLEKADFITKDAKILSMDDKHLKDVYTKLMIVDVKTNLQSARKGKNVPENSYGNHVADRLFLVVNFSWLENRVSNWNNWIRKNPYQVGTDGIGVSAKRFILTLKYGKTLYWVFIENNKKLSALYEEVRYKQLLELGKFEELIETKNRMIDRMTSLNFFSKETYLGENQLIINYLKKE